VAENSSVPVHRSDPVLRNVTWAVLALAIVSIIALLIGRLLGVASFATGIWPTVAIMPIIALPLFLVLFISQLLVSAVRRSRAAKDASE
jgi:hypothetical protein